MMNSLGLLVLLQVSVSVVTSAQTHPHGVHTSHVPPTHETTTISPGEVDAAIVNINAHYNDELCLELLLVDCATHVTKGDEQVCGSNGVTYDNHCHFAHAVCETLHFAGHQITFQSHGACAVTSVPLSTAATTTSGSGAVTHSLATTPGHTDAVTTKAPTTPDPMGAIVQNVFCNNLGSISCSGSFDVICGTDGQYYPNQCELSKAKCLNSALTISSDSTKCQASVGK